MHCIIVHGQLCGNFLSLILKCCLLEIGRNLSSPPFHISSVPYVNHVEDLGVHIERDFKFTQHINIISSRACQRGCQILRCFLSRNTSSLVRAYKVFVRPLIEYASVTWSPSQKQLINNIENVQRAFTRRLPGLKFLSYRERLENLKLRAWQRGCQIPLCFLSRNTSSLVRPISY